MTTQFTLSPPLAREDVDVILVNNDYRPVDVIALLRYQPLSPPVKWSVSPARWLCEGSERRAVGSPASLGSILQSPRKVRSST